MNFGSKTISCSVSKLIAIPNCRGSVVKNSRPETVKHLSSSFSSSGTSLKYSAKVPAWSSVVKPTSVGKLPSSMTNADVSSWLSSDTSTHKKSVCRIAAEISSTDSFLIASMSASFMSKARSSGFSNDAGVVSNALTQRRQASAVAPKLFVFDLVIDCYDCQ